MEHPKAENSNIRMSILVAATLGIFIFTIFMLRFKNPKTQQRSRLRRGRPLGVPNSQSNLSDEFTYTPDGDGDGDDEWRIKALYIYPIKSCRGIELDSAEVVKTGLRWDRQFMFAEKSAESREWKFLTQRNYPLLATIQTEIISPDEGDNSEAVLQVRAPTADPRRWWRPRRTFSFELPLEE
jgi:hypothetical protein